MSIPDEAAAPKPRRRVPAFVVVGVVGVVVIAVLVAREVASIREGERETDRHMAELDRWEAEGPTLWNVDAEEDQLGVVVRLAEVQRQGPDTAGRYHLDVGPMRWALELPPEDADDATWAAWEQQSRPRWAALARALGEHGASGVPVRAEIFAPWQAAHGAAPERLLLRLLSILGAAGIVEVDVEHAPQSLLEDD